MADGEFFASVVVICTTVVMVTLLCGSAYLAEKDDATCPGPLQAGDYYTPEE